MTNSNFWNLERVMADDRVTFRDLIASQERIEKKLDSYTAAIRTEVQANRDDIEQLQAFQNKSLGVLALLAFFFNLAASWIWNKITGGM